MSVPTKHFGKSLKLPKESFPNKMCVGNSLDSLYRYRARSNRVSPDEFVEDMYKTLADQYVIYFFRKTVTSQEDDGLFLNKNEDQNKTATHLRDVMKVCNNNFSDTFCEEVEILLKEMEQERRRIGVTHNLIDFSENP